MSRFSPCRSLTLEGVCAECACECAMRFHHLMNPGESFCIQIPSTKGINLVGDPSFNATYPGGPDSETFPGGIGAGIPPWELQWADGSAAPYAPWGVFSHNGGGTANQWELSTANPRTGSNHARFVYTSGESGEVQNSDMMPLGPEVCTGVTAGYQAFFSAIISPGDIINWSIWAARNSTDAFDVDMYIEIWSESWGAVLENGNYSQSLANGGTYAQFSYSTIAPANSYWLQAFALFYPAPGSFSSNGDTFDFDDASLVIT